MKEDVEMMFQELWDPMSVASETALNRMAGVATPTTESAGGVGVGRPLMCNASTQKVNDRSGRLASS